MADLTIPLIGLTTLVGYYFSKNGKDNRKQSKGIFTDDVDRRQGIFFFLVSLFISLLLKVK